MQLNDRIDDIRDETPACRELTHFNNAGFSLSPTPVVEAVIQHLRLEQEIGGYEAAEQADDQLENFYRAFAGLLNCDADEIAFVENATRAWDMAFYSIDFKAGDKVLTGQAEYASNYLAMLQMQRRADIEIVVIPSNAEGALNLEALEQAIDERVKLIALTHVPSQSGVVQPAEQVGEIARQHNILYLLDACQSAGQLSLDVARLGCDMLTGTGRKYLRGPRGTGFLYVNRQRLNELEPPFIDLHAASWKSPEQFEFRPDARRFENWECFIAGKIGLGVAVDYALALGLENINQRIQQLARQLIDQLGSLSTIQVYESASPLSGIVTFSSTAENPAALQQRLRAANINIGVSKQANAVLDFGRRGLGNVSRASLHYYNTADEIHNFIRVLSAKQ